MGISTTSTFLYQENPLVEGCKSIITVDVRTFLRSQAVAGETRVLVRKEW
jgi:hypothetical protein